MANESKSFLPGNGKRVVVETAPPDKINEVSVQSLIDAHLYYTGRESGIQYEWTKAGAIVIVDERDVPDLLARKLGKKTCCGGGDNHVFQLAQ